MPQVRLLDQLDNAGWFASTLAAEPSGDKRVDAPIVTSQTLITDTSLFLSVLSKVVEGGG